MAYETITTPTKLPDAFGLTDASAVQSQAAFLLYLGALDSQKRRMNFLFERKDTLDWPNSDSIGITEDLRELGILYPENLVKSQIQLRHSKFNVRQMFNTMGINEAFDNDNRINTEIIIDHQIRLAKALIENPEEDTIAQLIAVSLYHPNLLVRVSAAISGFDVLSDTGGDFPQLGKTLIEGIKSEDKLIQDVAATALARLVPNHPELASLTSNSSASGGGLITKNEGTTSLLIHGTWASSEKWWQPGGDFHDYYKDTCDHSLYSGNDRFEWSGSYSDRARWLGAFDLVNWIRQKGLTNLNLIGHSHGANITMLASQGHDMRMNTLVLLSCPVHWDEYWPDFTHVNKVVSIRVKLDLVILADRGGQRFPSNSMIVENVLPVWFNHSLTHDPETWQAYNIPSMI